MPSRDEILSTIDATLAARQRGDNAAIPQNLAENAQFRMVATAEKVPSEECCAREAAAKLIEMFEFHDVERVHAVVEGNVAAVHWRVRASTGGGPQVDTELFDLWTFNDEGKIASVVEFGDTALMAQMLG